jgi:hypothetical protein
METSKKANLTILPCDLLAFTIVTVGISKAKHDQLKFPSFSGTKILESEKNFENF